MGGCLLHAMRSCAVHPSFAVTIMLPLRDTVIAAISILSSTLAFRSYWLNELRYSIGRQVELLISIFGFRISHRSLKLEVLDGRASFSLVGCHILLLLLLLLPQGRVGC